MRCLSCANESPDAGKFCFECSSPFLPEAQSQTFAVLASELLGPQVDLGGLIFDRTGQRIFRGDLSEQLTPTEFRLLDSLVGASGNIAPTQDLLEQVWDYTEVTASSDVVRSHVKNLRAKIRRVNEGQDIIETVSRRGYRISCLRRTFSELNGYLIAFLLLFLSDSVLSSFFSDGGLPLLASMPQ